MSRRARAPLVIAAASLTASLLASEPIAATVEEQRARLPPATKCEDPVAGVWRAHHYTARFAQWYMFTLEVRRAAPGSDELTGKVHSHFWTGGPKQEQPPPCEIGRTHAEVEMPARGSEREGKIQFGGTSWTQLGTPCGMQPLMYMPDNFTGTIDPAIQEFQSVNNDGGNAVNEPTVFRRVKCFEKQRSERPKVVITPPPLMPEARSRGCSLPW